MRWRHGEHRLRLAYCLNLHPAEDLEGVHRGLREITFPLAERLGPERFGVGPWIPAALVRDLTADDRERLVSTLADRSLEAFTWNAFPFGGFHTAGLKQGVFAPTWADEERLDFTLDVARLAAEVARPEPGRPRLGQHAHGAASVPARPRSARPTPTTSRAVPPSSPSSSPTPASASCSPSNPSRARPRATRPSSPRSSPSTPERFDHDACRRHLGVCLDACHAAVEFEEPERVLANVAGRRSARSSSRAPCASPTPDADDEARERLLALDEPVYLHQVTGRSGGELLRATDLPEVGEASGPRAAAATGSTSGAVTSTWPVDLGDLAGRPSPAPTA